MRAWAAAGLLVLAGLAHAGETVTSADILAASADLDCLDYRPVGGCVWLRCGLFGCRTRVSVKFRHFVPDAVVTAYPARGRCPWTELRALEGPGEGGTYAKGAGARAATGLRFKLAQAAGSPGIAWIEALDLGTPVCDPGPTPLAPYYVSGLDPMWRAPELQAPLVLRHLRRAVRAPGAAGSLWGPVYPAHGLRAAGPRLQGGGGRRAAGRGPRDPPESAPRLPAAAAPQPARAVAARAGRRRRCGHPPVAAARPAKGRVRGVRRIGGVAHGHRRSARRERLRERRLRLEPVAPVPVLRAARAVAAVALGKLKEEAP